MIILNDPELVGEIMKTPVKCVSAKVFHDKEGRLDLEYHGEAETESGKIICFDIEYIKLDIGTLKYMSCPIRDRYIGINCHCITIPLMVAKDDDITIRYKEK